MVPWTRGDKNSKVEVGDGWCTKLVGFASSQSSGALGMRLLSFSMKDGSFFSVPECQQEVYIDVRARNRSFDYLAPYANINVY